MTHPPPAPSSEKAARLVQALINPDRDAAVLLTAHPGPRWSAGLAAALWDLPLGEAHQRLERLVHLGVLTRHEEGHHTMAIEVRAALERTAATVLLPGCRRARSRLVTYYAEHAIAADLALDPGRWRWHPPAVAQVRHIAPSPEAAQAWMDDESDNLASVVELAHHTCHHQQVILIAEAVGAWAELQRPHSHSTHRILEYGLACARAMDDDGAQAVMYHALAAHHLRLNQPAEAVVAGHYALALWASAEPRRARPYHERGLVHLHLLLARAHHQGREQGHHLPEAERYTDLAERVSHRYDHPRDTALIRYHQALTLHIDERLQDAAALLRSALHPLVGSGEQVWASHAHRALCEVLMDLGQHTDAHQHGQAALEALSSQVAPLVRAQAHESLAWVARNQQDPERARIHFEQAWACSAAVDPAYAQQMLAASNEPTHPTTAPFVPAQGESP